jgi:hypothetical protein
MSNVAVVPAAPPIAVPIAIPIRQWLPYIIFASVLMLYLLYVVGLEQGATSLIGGHMLHEWMHDARHLLGFPCH